MSQQSSSPSNPDQKSAEIDHPQPSPPRDDSLKHNGDKYIDIINLCDDDSDENNDDDIKPRDASVSLSPLQPPQSKRKRIKSDNDHYNNIDHKAKKMKREVINLTSSDSESETTSSSNSVEKINKFNRNNPIYLDGSDDEHDADDIKMYSQRDDIHKNDQNAICTVPDFDEDDVMSYRFDDEYSMSPGSTSPSPSLSVGSLTIRFRDTLTMNDADDHKNSEYWSHTNQILKTWKDQANPHEITMRALGMIRNITMPRKECIELIKLIRTNHNSSNIVHGSLSYRNRLIAMTIGLLEVMNLRTRDENNWNSSDKPQVLLIAPRRHMALEARKLFMQIGQFYALNCETLIGGMPSYKCIQTLRGGLDIITGTPGKLSDMVRRGVLNNETLSKLVAFAMDGGEELMTGMKNDLLTITNCFPNHPIKMLWLESITDRNAATQMIRDMNGNSPHDMEVYDDNDLSRFAAVKHLQKHIKYDKIEGLEQILRYYTNDKVVCFFDTRYELRRTFSAFTRDPNRCAARPQEAFYLMDGHCNNDYRAQAANKWRETSNGVMFGTDLIKFGIDLNCKIIIMMRPPRNGYKQYVERIAITNVEDVCVITMTKTNEDSRHLDHIVTQMGGRLVSYHEFSQKRRKNKSIRGESVANELQTCLQ